MATPQRNSPNRNAHGSRFAFSRAKLVTTIATFALFLTLLVPIFAAMAQKAEVQTCQDNLRQFTGAILLYSADYDRAMPFAISGHNQIGPEVASNREVQEFNLPLEVLPYVRDSGIFGCPEDNGFAGSGFVNLPGQGNVPFPVPSTTRARDAYGTSYRITRQSFTEFGNIAPGGPFYDAVCPLDPAEPGCRGLGDDLTLPGRPGPGVTPPSPLWLSFFARPAETTLLADDWAWANSPADGNPLPTHAGGANVAFADGHVKFVVSRQARDGYCAGPTFSPARLGARGRDRGPAFGDGSCNTGGLERRSFGDMN